VILEGLVTTLSAAGEVNLAPMGPHVPDGPADGPLPDPLASFVLKPFRTSRTYQNLKEVGEGVLHVTDDVLLLAQAAVGQPDPLPPLMTARKVQGQIVASACRYAEFRVTSCEDRQERATLHVEVVHTGRLRNFFGFNRAMFAVVEAAILATRIAFLPREQIETEYARLAVLVEKTGGPREREAFALLQRHVALASDSCQASVGGRPA